MNGEDLQSLRFGAKTSVLSVKLYQTFDMLPSRALKEGAGALTQVVVHHDGLRIVDNFPSGPFQAKAQVDILAIEEKAFII